MFVCCSDVFVFFSAGHSVSMCLCVVLMCLCVVLQAIACPFAARSPAVDFSRLGGDWLGHIKTADTGRYIDLFGVVALGGIPWQVGHRLCDVLCYKGNLAPNRGRLATDCEVYFAGRHILVGELQALKCTLLVGVSW